jgi:hypothetical protein
LTTEANQGPNLEAGFSGEGSVRDTGTESTETGRHEGGSEERRGEEFFVKVWQGESKIPISERVHSAQFHHNIDYLLQLNFLI